MGYSESVLHSAQARLAARRGERQAQQEAQRREIFRTLPRSAELDRQLRRTMVQVVAAALREGPDPGPALARIRAENGALLLSDREPYDYCRAERILKPAPRQEVSFRVAPAQNDCGSLFIELTDARETPAVRLVFRPDGKLYARTVCELPMTEYRAGESYDIRISLDCRTFRYSLWVNGALVSDSLIFMAAVNEVSRFILRTGERRHSPTLDDIPDDKPEVPLPGCDEPAPETAFTFRNFRAQGEE